MNLFKLKVRAFWRKVPAPLRAAWVALWVTFTGGLVTIGLNLLPVLANAFTTRNFEPVFDSLSLAATASISLAFGFVGACVNAIYRVIVPVGKAYVTDKDIENEIRKLSTLQDTKRPFNDRGYVIVARVAAWTGLLFAALLVVVLILP